MKYNDKDILTTARNVLNVEHKALELSRKSLDAGFLKAVKACAETKGRVVVLGIGKSGLIGRKISATLASTGTPSFFVHPVEALHGDLGMIMSGDVILAISFSGQTEEINKILPSLARRKLTIISMTGHENSKLALMSDIHVKIYIDREACPYNLAPTASTTATLAVGDALAVCLMKIKHFEKTDFALFHPGGSFRAKYIPSGRPARRRRGCRRVRLNNCLKGSGRCRICTLRRVQRLPVPQWF